MLAKSKLRNTGMIISTLLIAPEISQEDYITIINEAEKYRRLKEDIIIKKNRSNGGKIN